MKNSASSHITCLRATTSACVCITTLTLAGISNAATIAHWRMGDDTSYLFDSSGNGNNLAANTGNQTSLPASGNGSSFFDPIPQTGASNDNAADFNGTNGGDRAIIDDFFDSSSDFTVESLFNMETANNSRDQFIISQYDSSGDQRSWAIGVADGDSGNSGAAAGELFLWLSSDGTFSGASIVSLGLTITAGTDYYVGIGFDNASNANDISFYYQDLTNGGSLQSTSISSGITSLFNSSADLELAAFNVDDNNFAGLIDEVRISTGVLSQSDLLAIPEPSTFALLVGLTGLGWAMTRRNHKA